MPGQPKTRIVVTSDMRRSHPGMHSDLLMGNNMSGIQMEP